MVRGGVDVVEVGLPYCDPLMDGPTIQAAVEAALRGGTTTDDVLGTVAKVAATGAPTLVMTLLEPDRALRRRAGSPTRWPRPARPGVITPDLTPDEAGRTRRTGSAPPTPPAWTGSSWSRPPRPRRG